MPKANLRDAFINPAYVNDDERMASYATSVEAFALSVGAVSSAAELLTAFNAIYDDALNNEEGEEYTQEEHQILILGLREDRLDELDRQLENKEISERDYEYLVNGMIGRLDGSSFPVEGNPRERAFGTYSDRGVRSARR